MILFFSGTGNSRYLAERLGAMLGDETREMMPFSMLTEESEIADKRVIWVFPVHSWGMPALVVDFIKRVKIVDGAKHFMVCSCGDDIGLTNEQWRAMMACRKWDAVAAYSVIMPNTYVLLPGFDVDPVEIASGKLDAAAARISNIASRIELGWEGDDVTAGAFPSLKSKLFYPFFERFMQSPKPFRCDESLCCGCGKCAARCPMGNVTLDSNRRPKWGEKCTMCLYCYHICPVHAVNYGSRTKNKGQYLCPLH